MTTVDGAPALYSAPAEMSVLGGMLLDPESISHAVELVVESDFCHAPHRRLFRALVHLHGAGQPVEPVTLTEHLRERGELESVGGVEYLSRLWDYVPTAANLAYHAGIVARLGALRQVERASREIRDLVTSPGNRSADEIHAEAERRITEAAPAVRGEPLAWIHDLMLPAVEWLERLGTDKEEPRFHSGIGEVDRLLGGFERGSLVVIAGRPSMGKSAFGNCNLVAHAVLREDAVGLISSLETKRDRVVHRLIASESRVDLLAARRRGGFREEDYHRISDATARLNTAPLVIENRLYTIDQLRARARRVRREKGRVDVILVDYLQLMKAPQYAENRTQEVSFISRELKMLAEEFDAVVIALSQLSRAVESRPDKRPMMSDLRESGQLEQDADFVGLLYRPEYYFGSEMMVGRGKSAHKVNVEGKAEVIWGKVRDGETGSSHLAFRKEFTLFEDYRDGHSHGH